MKGFLIEVKNDLLDPKHFEAMGIAVWLYMWLLDHVTKIDDDGKGWVLGGKPIKFEEVTAELGMSQDSYTRWIQTLVDYPYIEVTRTGYGIIFKILKAKKRFRKPMEPDSAEVRNQIPQKRGTSIRTSAESNKTVSVDSISKTSAKAENESENSEIQYETDEDFVPTRDLKKRQKPAKKMHKEIYELFPGYKPHWLVNQRIIDAANRLFNEKGIEKCTKALDFYEENKVEPYCPQIYTPIDLEEKWDKLRSFRDKLENDES